MISITNPKSVIYNHDLQVMQSLLLSSRADFHAQKSFASSFELSGQRSSSRSFYTPMIENRRGYKELTQKTEIHLSLPVEFFLCHGQRLCIKLLNKRQSTALSKRNGPRTEYCMIIIEPESFLAIYVIQATTHKTSLHNGRSVTRILHTLA